MARNLRRRYWLSILTMLVVVSGIWGGIAIAGWKPQLGLDLQGGISVVMAPRGPVKQDALEKAVDIIRQRIDALGVAEPDVSRQGNNILIEIPGIKDRKKALEVIGRTAELRMRPVLAEIPAGSPQWAQSPPADCDSPFGKDNDEATASPTPSPKPTAKTSPKPSPKATASPTPAATGISEDPTKPTTLCVRAVNADGKAFPANQWTKVQLGPAALVGTDIDSAQAQPAGGGASLTAVGWEVQLKLTGEGAKKFEQTTGKLACNQTGDVKRQLAIVLDGIVESHPQMGEEVKCDVGISGGTAVISGNFGEKDAKALALVLRFGALPVALEAQETNEVSPTLGRDSLQGGLLAGAIGLAVTMIYVLLFYRVLGFLIWLGLALHAAFTMGVVIILGETAGFALSLAGIAGLIVSIGIAADSFIVYYERLKDEVHTGKTIRSSVDRAWASAWRTIVAADLVTALAAAALYLLAVGGVRGFALMLGLSTALDLFISYLVMHPMVWILSQTKFFNNSKRLGIKNVVGDAQPSLAGGQR